MSNNIQSSSPDLMPAKLIYGLFALGYFVGITTLAGVVFAYLSRGKSEVLDSHLRFQIRTFWLSLLIAVIGFITLFIGVGMIILMFLVVWGFVRLISGFLLANDGKPVTGTKYWGILAV